jgi:hypothetical protein
MTEMDEYTLLHLFHYPFNYKNLKQNKNVILTHEIDMDVHYKDYRRIPMLFLESIKVMEQHFLHVY